MCGGELSPKSIQYCPFHLEANRVETVKKKEKREDEGRCVRCGKPLPEDSILLGLNHCGCEEIWRLKAWN